MATTTVKVKRGDVGITFLDELQFRPTPTSDLEPVPLTGATVWFLLRPRGGAAHAKVEAQALVDNVSTAAVHYTTVLQDLDTVGKYNQEWEIRYVGGKILTVPSDGYNLVVVEQDLNPEG